MKPTMLPLAALPLAILLVAAGAAGPMHAQSPAQSFAPEQKNEIEKIIREYLLSHP